jgi:hypothetical protein
MGAARLLSSVEAAEPAVMTEKDAKDYAEAMREGGERRFTIRRSWPTRNRIAIETEWNNKDPFYDRDLTTFRLLFELNVLSVGVIITRASELQQIFDELGRGKSYGNSTTHMGKLVPKLNNRASGGCPVLAFGMKKSAYDSTK